MYVSINRFWQRISVSVRSLLWLSLGVALAISSRMAVGQEGHPPAATQFGDSVQDSWLFSDQLSGQSGEAFGALVRAGVLTGPAVGRDESIVPIELMPYAFLGKGLIFGDVRGFRATSDQWGANLGGGIRYHSDRFDRIFGANVFYDYDNTSGVLFRQMGFGLESLGALYDVRANAYFPTGVTEQLISVNYVPGSERFVGHQIRFDQRRIIGNALSGVDMEVATPLPGRVMQRHEVRVAGGWYHYRGEDVDAFTGWKTRIQGNLFPSVELQVEVTNDSQFQTNVVFGATWTYGGYRQPETERRSQFSRMTEPVRRNYNIVVAKTAVLDVDLVAFNPNTGDEYFVEHVASDADPGGDGTYLAPWQTVNEAQTDPNFAPRIAAAGGDIIFVHADSVYDQANFPADNSVTLTPSIRILGEGNGVEHRISVSGLLAPIPLPRATAGVSRPIFAGNIGDGVTLVSGSTTVNSEFSGFLIGDPNDTLSGPTGNGIFGNGVGNVLVTQTDVNFAGGDGVLLSNLSGPVTFRGSHINNPTGVALHVTGGSGGVNFGDDPVSNAQGRITNSGDYALLIENTLAGSFVNMTGAAITDTSGLGVLIDNADGTITVDDTTINDSLGMGLEINGGSTTVNFRGLMDIDNALLDSISIHDTLLASRVTFQPTLNGVRITDRNAHAINLFNNAGLVRFSGPVSITSGLFPAAAAAVEYQDSSGNVQFQNLNISGGTDDGIVIGGVGPFLNNTGQFQVLGTTTIAGLLGNGIAITDDDARVRFDGDVTISSRGLSGISVTNSRGSVAFNGLTRITNELGSISAAVDIQGNTTAAAVFDILTITDATRPLPLAGGAGLNVVNNLPSVTVGTLNVTTLDGVALFANNAGDTAALTPTGGLSVVGGGVIDSVGSGAGNGLEAVFVQDSVIQLNFTSVSSSDSAFNGITLIDNVGVSDGILFNVTGTNAVPLSGGTIEGAAGDGAYFENTGGVSLANMSIEGNAGNGIFITDCSEFFLGGTLVQVNGGVGVEIRDTPIATVQANTISGNGLSEFRFIATESALDGYTLTLGGPFLANGNLITDGSDDAVVIQTQGAGGGSRLNLQVLNNTLGTIIANTSVFSLNWNGAVQGDINQNIFNYGRNGATGMLVNLGTNVNGFSSNLNILSNTFNSPTGVDTTGIDLTTNGAPATINIGRQQGQANGNVMTVTSGSFFTNNVGMRFALGSGTNISVSDNLIDMLADQATAIEFTNVQGLSNITMENNVISVATNVNSFNFNEFGIQILSLSGSVNLFGTGNNDVLINNQRGTISPWFSAPNTINGQITVNNGRVP